MGQSKNDTNSRPGWRGPGRSKPSKAPPASKKKDPDPASEPSLPWVLQQLLLNIFRTTFTRLSEGGREAVTPKLEETLQEIKQALFARDFRRAFGRQDYLEAYAFRWSPSRALCYANMLVDLRQDFFEILPAGWNGRGQASAGDAGRSEEIAIGNGERFNVTCIGGGAAEVVAFSGFLHHLQNAILPQPTTDAVSLAESTGRLPVSVDDAVPPPEAPLKLKLHLIDLASWSSIITALTRSLTTPPTLSKYASSWAIASATPLISPSALSVSFTQSNILTLSPEKLSSLLAQSSSPRPQLVTLLFTLNELYTASVSQTTAFLLNLTASVPRGTLLLVIDSPGSYSIARLGGGSGSSIGGAVPNFSPGSAPSPCPSLPPDPEDKKTSYPMDWLLDHTLLENEKDDDDDEYDQKKPPRHLKWQKVTTNISRWFRLPPGLKYPHPLENMRYQVHLYRRL